SSPRFYFGNDNSIRAGALEESVNRRTESVHIKVRIRFAAAGQGVFLVPGAEFGSSSKALQNGGNAAGIGIYLHRRPREIICYTGVLGLDAYKIGITVGKAPPETLSGVVAPSSGYHVISTVAAETELGQRPREIRSAVLDDAEARHISTHGTDG